MTSRVTDAGTRTKGTIAPVSLVIPCRPEYVGLCRLVVGALGTRDSLDEEMVADLKVIVTEACNCFFALASSGNDLVAPAGCSIRLDFDSRPEAFVISVLYPRDGGIISWLEQRDPASEVGLGLTILRALTDEMVELASPEPDVFAAATAGVAAAVTAAPATAATDAIEAADSPEDGKSGSTILRLTKRLPA